MSRREFMQRLEGLLGDIPASERQDALNYYENYFEDAGLENEAKIIAELESPEKVAISIKKDLYGEDYDKYYDANGRSRQQAQTQRNNTKMQRNILIAIILVLTFPVWIGIVGGVFGAAFGLLVAALAVVVGFIACVAACLIGGCVVVGVGFVKMFTGFPALGLLAIALGLVMLVLAILGILAICWILSGLIPWLVRTVMNLGKRIFRQRGGNA